ncbi:MAG: right-handed parallel beta-helix repeat-containing protein [Kiritimatiellae bacterium]|nr:right-handed parallel beta-helix repeat-containing protein [Kiritimatiellia bacterium]
MTRLRSVCLAVLVVCGTALFTGAGSASATAAVYYIDPSAAAGGDGSQAKPWRGWEQVEWQEGGTYLQRAGTTWSGLTVDVRANGVTLGKYGSGPLPVLKLMTKGGNTPVVNINGRTDCTVQDLRFEQGTGEKAGTSGVKVRGQVGVCRILRCQFTVLKFGIRLESAKAEKVLIDGCEMWNFGDGPRGRGGDGIWAVCDNLEVCNCHMHDLDQSAEDGIQGAWETDNWHIHHNRIDESASNRKQCIIISGTVKTKAPLIEHNELIGPPSCVMLIDTGGIVRYNRLLSSRYGLTIITRSPDCRPVEFYGNLVRDCKDGVGIGGDKRWSEEPKAQVSIVNNTFIGIRQYGVILRRGANLLRAPLILKNNIFFLPEPASMAMLLGLPRRDVISDHNCFYPEKSTMIRFGPDTFDSLGAFQEKTGFDTHSIAADPLFAGPDSFRLRSGSPCPGRGAGVEGIRMDFAGNLFRDPPVIGALEFGSEDTLQRAARGDPPSLR